MSNNNLFRNVAGLHPGMSVFDLSYTKLLTCDMGQLIPVMCDEVVPGDIFKIGNQSVIRMQPLVAPVLHEINAYVHYFFVPYRLLWDGWETFITGGADGADASTLPLWSPSFALLNVFSMIMLPFSCMIEEEDIFDFIAYATSLYVHPIDFAYENNFNMSL